LVDSGFGRILWLGRVASRIGGVLLVALLSALLFASPAHAATVTVTTNADDSINNGNCTLREAIIAANTNAAVDGCTAGASGADTINFAIPGSGPHTIAPTSQLPTITQPLTINGYSQGSSTTSTADDATPNTLTGTGTDAVLKIVLSGASASPGTSGVSGLWISGGGTTIRGLVINGFRSSPTLERGEGIFLLNVAGNTNNVIEGNFIGTAADGVSEESNQSGGIVAFGQSTGNTIGGSDPADRNIVSGNRRNGIEVQSNGNEIRGNLVGTDRTGATDLGNGLSGILVGGGNSGNAVSGNLVAFNGFHGVRVQDSTTIGTSILSNAIFANDSNEGMDVLGIDLNNDGVTPNDPGDADTGPNSLQNFPKITLAQTSRRGTIIRGKLNSTDEAPFTIQFFSSPQTDPSGFGEGETFLVEKEVTTDDEGRATFTFRSPTKVKRGQIVTATATDSDGSTSEFSATRKVRRT
jgi:CSLREA domain-containing protein